MEGKISTQEACARFVGVNFQAIARWQAFNGFPKPEKVKRRGKSLCVWEKSEIEKWLSENEDLVQVVKNYGKKSI